MHCLTVMFISALWSAVKIIEEKCPELIIVNDINDIAISDIVHCLALDKDTVCNAGFFFYLTFILDLTFVRVGCCSG